MFIDPFPAPLTPLPVIPFEEITGCTNETAKSANKAPRNLPSCFFVSCFTLSVNPSINTHKSSNHFIILIKSFISSFETNKVNPFHAPTASFPLIFFFSNSFTRFEVKLLANPGKLCLTKATAIFISVFFPKLPNQEPKNPTD